MSEIAIVTGSGLGIGKAVDVRFSKPDAQDTVCRTLVIDGGLALMAAVPNLFSIMAALSGNAGVS